MYDLTSYAWMAADAERITALAAAVEAASPNRVVLDLGCGTGIVTLLACRAGARCVYAIDTNPALEVARRLIRENGYQDKVKFFCQRSQDVQLPERVDLIVADLRGQLPYANDALLCLKDARSRFLKAGGRMIPLQDVIRAAVVDASDAVPNLAQPAFAGLSLEPWATRMSHEYMATSEKTVLLSPEQTLGALDYEQFQSPDFAGTTGFTITQGGVAHGVLVWFDTRLDAHHKFSNAPSESRTPIYRRALFRWPQPRLVKLGQTLEFRLDARYVAAWQGYHWAWSTRFDASGDSFRQSTFGANQLSLDKMKACARDARPTRSREGQQKSFILGLMEGDLSVSEIVAAARERFPDVPDIERTAEFTIWKYAHTEESD